MYQLELQQNVLSSYWTIHLLFPCIMMHMEENRSWKYEHENRTLTCMLFFYEYPDQQLLGVVHVSPFVLESPLTPDG
jgi:hypothetical protein